MRDFLVVMIVLGSVPLILVRPYIGIVMWFWLSMMNPHKLAWGYAQQFRVALVVGGVTLFAWLVSRERKVPPNTSVTWSLALFTIWVSLAAMFAIHPEVAIPKWEEIVKILGMTFVTMCIVQSRERINWLVWVVALSIGIYGIKGGIFAIATGGSYRVYGPLGSFIEENNALALALIVVLPLFQYLRISAADKWVKFGLTGAMGLIVISILASYSRGALLGLALTLGALFLKSRRRFTTLVIVGSVLGAGLLMFPDVWFQRMQSIEHFQKDDSAMGRIDAWTFAYKLALDHPLVGGGQLVGTDGALFKHYVPNSDSNRAAHSIYFEVLGETGFVGLGIFLTLMYSSFRAASNILKLTRDRPDLQWARSLAAMLQVSFVGYATTGAFLSLGFFDLYYVLVAVVAVTQAVVRREIAKVPVAQSAPSLIGSRPITDPVYAFAGAQLAGGLAPIARDSEGRAVP